MTALLILVAYAAFIYALAKTPGEAIWIGLAGVWAVMGLWALGSIAFAVLSR